MSSFLMHTSVSDQVDKLYWDGEVVQKSRKKDHTSKAEQLWKVSCLLAWPCTCITLCEARPAAKLHNG